MDIHVTWWMWILVSAIFLFVELMTVTFFGLWMAIAAIVPAATVFLFPDITIAGQLTLWIVSMLVCAYCWVKILDILPALKDGDPYSVQTGA